MSGVRNYVVDFFIFLCFIVTTVTGMVLFIAPRGNRSVYQEFLGTIKGDWVWIHEWAGIVMIVLVVVHVVLHWKWIASMTRKILKIK